MGMNLLSISFVDNKMGWSVLDNKTFDLLSYGEIDITMKRDMTHEEFTLHSKKIIETLIEEYHTPIINLDSNVKETLAHTIIKTVIFIVVHTNNLKLILTDREECLKLLDIRLARGNDLNRQMVDWVNNKYNLGLFYKNGNYKDNGHIGALSICLGSYQIGNFEELVRIGRQRRR